MTKLVNIIFSNYDNTKQCKIEIYSKTDDDVEVRVEWINVDEQKDSYDLWFKSAKAYLHNIR